MSAESSLISGGTQGVILPEAQGALGEFWRGVSQGKLLLQHCRKCKCTWHPPTDVCIKCQSLDIEWIPARGAGTLHSFTVVRHAVHPVVAQWIPYTLAVVALEEGPRVLSLLEKGGIPKIGASVQLRFRKMPQDFQLPVFSMLEADA